MSRGSPSPKRGTRLPLMATAGAAVVVAAQSYYAGHRLLPHFDDLDVSVPATDPGATHIQIAVLGDSTVTGPGLDEPSGLWLHQALAVIDGPGHSVSSFAKGGAKTSDVVADQLDRAIAISPDLAVVSVGTNDSIRGVTIAAMRRDLVTIVSALAETAIVVLMGVGDLATIPRLPQPLAALVRLRGRMADRMQLEVASNHDRVLKIPMYEIAGPVFRANDGLFAPDLFHPNQAGHRVWATAAAPTLHRAIDHVAECKDAR